MSSAEDKQIEKVLSRLEALEKDNADLREVNAEMRSDLKSQFKPKASTSDEIALRNQRAEARGFIEPVLKDHSGITKTIDEFGEVHEKEIPFTGKKNECPFCNAQKKPSMLDINNSGVWQCRRCGKGWMDDALGKPYSRKLEREQYAVSEEK